MEKLVSVVMDLLRQVFEARLTLGNRFAEEHEEKTSRGKRQSRLEFAVSEILAGLQCPADFGLRIEAEGYQAFTIGNEPSAFVMFVDPVDGTSNTARWQACGNRVTPESVTTVIAVAPNIPGLTLGDFVIGAGLDLRNGQIWLAQKGQGTITAEWGQPPIALERRVQHHRHSPLLACEFYRCANWITRLLINQPVEWADTASSFMNMLRVPLGEADCFFNNPLALATNIQGRDVVEGQRGHELGAISVFVQELGAYGINAGTGQPLAESPFLFDGMTPVIIGVNRETAEYYQQMIQANLGKLVKLNGVPVSVSQLVSILHAAIGTAPWSLRALPK